MLKKQLFLFWIPSLILSTLILAVASEIIHSKVVACSVAFLGGVLLPSLPLFLVLIWQNSKAGKVNGTTQKYH